MRRTFADEKRNLVDATELYDIKKDLAGKLKHFKNSGKIEKAAEDVSDYHNILSRFKSNEKKLDSETDVSLLYANIMKGTLNLVFPDVEEEVYLVFNKTIRTSFFEKEDIKNIKDESLYREGLDEMPDLVICYEYQGKRFPICVCELKQNWNDSNKQQLAGYLYTLCTCFQSKVLGILGDSNSMMFYEIEKKGEGLVLKESRCFYINVKDFRASNSKTALSMFMASLDKGFEHAKEVKNASLNRSAELVFKSAQNPKKTSISPIASEGQKKEEKKRTRGRGQSKRDEESEQDEEEKPRSPTKAQNQKKSSAFSIAAQSTEKKKGKKKRKRRSRGSKRDEESEEEEEIQENEESSSDDIVLVSKKDENQKEKSTSPVTAKNKGKKQNQTKPK